VIDIAKTQLDPTASDWKTHDLLVGEQPIDVKSARQSSARPDRYSEYFVPKFKAERRSGKDIVITSVLNTPYRSAESILEGAYSRSLVLGEVTQRQLDDLAHWIKLRFQGAIEVSNFAASNRIPGWCFDYGWNSRLDDSDFGQNFDALVDLLRHERNVRREIKLPKMLIALMPDHAREKFLGVDTDLLDRREADKSVLKEIIGLRQTIGLSRGSIFLFVVSLTISNIHQNSENWSPISLHPWLFWDATSRSKVWPLGVHDPLAYVAEILFGMEALWNTSKERLTKYTSFRLKGPSILVGMDSSGAEQTLIAYCGGWRQLGQRPIKCGQSPLILGLHASCRKCGRLVCDNCGSCMDGCRSE
jgi:hypothetical protein